VRAPARVLLLLAAALGGCGPYAELAQKLDVGVTIAGGEAWISATGSEVRVLVLGPPDPTGAPAPFAFTSMSLPIAAGTAVWSTQGVWTGTAADPSITLREMLLYRMDDERGTPLLERHGATRTDVDRTLPFGQSRAGGRLVLSGDPSMAGTYVLLPEALARLGSSSPADAACAFHVANLAVLSSEVRIIGFGSAGMTQYKTSASFRGTVSGSVNVAVHGTFSVTTDITYTQFSDFAGVRIDGTQTTNVDAGGNGSMSGTVSLALFPQPSPPAQEIDGSISYGSSADPGDAIQISSGSPTGGNYIVTLAGGGTTKVSPVGVPSPNVSECLGLPPP
jgi:hypothetical protein